MIDFMVNIKNKKSMKKYNVKTLAEIAVLCIFCDNIQVWSMNDSDVRNPNPEDNSPIPINEIKMDENSFENMNSDMENSQRILLNPMGSEKLPSNIYMLNSKPLDWKERSLNENKRSKMKNYTFSLLKGKNYNKKNLGERNIIHSKSSFRSSRKISSKKINKNKENKLELLFFNDKGHLSICCCFNFFNGNMENHGFRKKREIKIIRGKRSSECSEKSKNVDSSKKDKSKDVNNYEPRPDNNNNIITLNKNINFQVENNNGKNFTNGNPDSGNPQKIINNTTNSNPFKEE